MVPSRALILALIAGAAFASGCTREPPPPSGPTPAERATRAAFERGEAAWRAQRREALLAPDGWTSLVGLHWVTPGPHYVGRERDNGIRLSVGPPQLGMIDLRAERIRFVPDRGAALSIDGRTLRGATDLRADDAPEGASRIGFDDGKGIATVIRRGDRHALRVRHADAPSRTGFAGLQYWPGGPDWTVDARFERHPPGRTIPIASIVGGVEAMPNPGAVVFQRGGRTYRLQALEGADGGLFLIFADRTNGHGSYGAGRYLDASAPDAGGRVRLEFNRAYNPPCAFTPFATCPLPPPENRLDLAIPAGEKAYAGTH
jgi:uncharacterized protein (DUF1684 family)